MKALARGEQSVERAAIIPVELVNGPGRDRRLDQRLHEACVVSTPALLQPPGERIARVRELRQGQFEQIINLVLELSAVFHDALVSHRSRVAQN